MRAHAAQFLSQRALATSHSPDWSFGTVDGSALIRGIRGDGRPHSSDVAVDLGLTPQFQKGQAPSVRLPLFQRLGQGDQCCPRLGNLGGPLPLEHDPELRNRLAQ